MDRILTQKENDGCFKSAIIVILIALLLTICSRTQAQCFKQPVHPNTIYLAVQPIDIGLGIRYDYHINRLGLYNSITYGDLYLYRHNGIKNHVKVTTGISLPLRDYNTGYFDATIGINYHYSDPRPLPNNWWYSLLKEYSRIWSFELGLSVKFKYFAIAVRTDIPRWEPCFDFGIPIKYRRR